MRISKKQLFTYLRVFTAGMTLLLLTSTVLERPDRDGYQATHLYFMPRRTWEMDYGRGMLYSEDSYSLVDLEVLAEVLGVDYYTLAADRIEREREEYGEESPYERYTEQVKAPPGEIQAGRELEEREWYEGRSVPEWERELYETYGKPYSTDVSEELAGEGAREGWSWEPAPVPEASKDPPAEKSPSPASASSKGKATGPGLRRAPYEPNLQGNTIPLESRPFPLPDTTYQALITAAFSSCACPLQADVPTPPPKRISLPAV